MRRRQSRYGGDAGKLAWKQFEKPSEDGSFGRVAGENRSAGECR